MIRLKLGRRVGAVLVVLLLLLNLVAPLAGASASSSNLPPVGWAETVSAFLMSCGIYPFETDENGDYTEWSATSLVPLWNQFRDDVASVSNDIWDMVGYLVNGVIAIASGRWSVLREFASWLVTKFNVTDNQTGIELGENLSAVSPLPVYSSGSPSFSTMQSEGFFFISGTSLMSPFDGVYPYMYRTSASYILTLVCQSAVATNLSNRIWYSYTALGNVQTLSGSGGSGSISISVDDTVYTILVSGLSWVNLPSGNTLSVYTSHPDAIRAIFGSSSFSGVTADTTTVSVPSELPADTQYGGLTVAGAGAAVSVGPLVEIIQEAIMEGLKPTVDTVNVNLSPDIEVNPDTGEITQGEMTVTPADIDLVASDYQIRQLHTVFPFSIPWDVANVFSALNAQPVRPYWEVSLTLPGILGQPDTQIPFVIGVSDDSPLAGPVDTFAALIRNFLLVLMCVGTLMLFRKR